MKFRLSPPERRDVRVPHAWFAWRPVVATHPRGGQYLVWLAYVNRAGTPFDDSLGGGISWTYTDDVVWYP